MMKHKTFFCCFIISIKPKSHHINNCCCSVTNSCLTLQPPGLQNARLPYPLQSPRACSNSRALSQWCYPTISSSVALFFSCPQSYPASGPFPMNQLFTPSDQSIRASASASDFPMNIQGWFPLVLTDLISLLSKELSRVFYNTTVQKFKFFSTKLTSWSISHIHTWLLEKP